MGFTILLTVIMAYFPLAAAIVVTGAVLLFLVTGRKSGIKETTFKPHSVAGLFVKIIIAVILIFLLALVLSIFFPPSPDFSPPGSPEPTIINISV